MTSDKSLDPGNLTALDGEPEVFDLYREKRPALPKIVNRPSCRRRPMRPVASVDVCSCIQQQVDNVSMSIERRVVKCSCTFRISRQGKGYIGREHVRRDTAVAAFDRGDELRYVATFAHLPAVSCRTSGTNRTRSVLSCVTPLAVRVMTRISCSPAPTGMIIRPFTASWSTSACGT